MFKVDLSGKVAVVTGGGIGIGKSIALELAKSGASVVVSSRKKENLDSTVEEIEGMGGSALAVAADVSVPEHVDNLIQQTVDTFGTVDILVNNAGASFAAPAEDITPNGWDKIIGINLKGPFLCSRAAAKVMIDKNKGGRIINISSVGGVNGSPGMCHYGAAKAGLINLTQSLGIEWAKHNIYVNCISPGLILTEGVRKAMELTPDSEKEIVKNIALNRAGVPEEIASAVFFLSSDASNYMTGENINVAGGPASAMGVG